MSALDALLGQLAVNGQPVELRGTLNFASGFTITDEPDMNTIRVDTAGPKTGSVVTANAAPTPVLPAVATLVDNSITFIHLRVVARIASPSTTTMVYEEYSQAKRVN